MDGTRLGRSVLHVEDGDVLIVGEDFSERRIGIECGNGWFGHCVNVLDFQPGGIVDQLVSPQIHEKIVMLEEVSTDDGRFHICNDEYPHKWSSQSKVDGDPLGTVCLDSGTVCGEELLRCCRLEALFWRRRND